MCACVRKISLVCANCESKCAVCVYLIKQGIRENEWLSARSTCWTLFCQKMKAGEQEAGSVAKAYG